jgi:hypothetical protein
LGSDTFAEDDKFEGGAMFIFYANFVLFQAVEERPKITEVCVAVPNCPPAVKGRW